ncbi:hypothetical protein HMPREF1869_01782 [Bacteroidales bacterium KA00251]|nr:hypothetical protein HMPREF1869_01782 [Bacteroidales bacterium KA00251]
MSNQKTTTKVQFSSQLATCRTLFEKKLYDYKASWRALRPSSLTDQILIKALRIRTVSTKGESLVEDSIKDEFIGIVNYGIIGMIQCELGVADEVDLSNEEALLLYDRLADETQELMFRKNHDYGEAWRKMRISSFTDIILTKLIRIKQIEDLNEKTKVSEGVVPNYQDIVNYAIFALIRLEEQNDQVIHD